MKLANMVIEKWKDPMGKDFIAINQELILKKTGESEYFVNAIFINHILELESTECGLKFKVKTVK